MGFMKKCIASAALLAMVGTASNCLADEYCVENGGCGFNDCCRASSLAPAIALGTIAVIAIVAVAVQNTSGHSHCHSHN